MRENCRNRPTACLVERDGCACWPSSKECISCREAPLTGTSDVFARTYEHAGYRFELGFCCVVRPRDTKRMDHFLDRYRQEKAILLPSGGWAMAEGAAELHRISLQGQASVDTSCRRDGSLQRST